MKTRSNRLYIDPETNRYYLEIKRRFNVLQLSNSDLFSLALAVGRYYNVKTPLNKKKAFIRFETISSELLAMIDLLAINEYGVNNQEFFDTPIFGFDLAEEYANAGIKILFEKVYSSNQDFDEFLFETIFDLYDDMDLKS
ncbi:MAG: hypothetical protein IJ287_07765 [Methanobrevibacter sp.]|nr:hypothetical protein [Methanobrevibacter sp.]